jgi:hopanoid biosynthesis associated protein HpnK
LELIPDFLRHLRYAAVGVGAFFEGEAVLLSSGALARCGALSWPLVALAGTLGSVAWGQAWFQVGRASGKSLLVRRPSWRGRAGKVERWLARFGPLVLLAGRFMLGLGTVLPALIGASGFARRRFFFWDTLGAMLWASAFSGAGYALGALLPSVAGREIGWFAYAALGVGAAATISLLAAGLRALASEASAAPLAEGNDEQAPADKRVIITADDFGLAVPVNEAVELAHREGVLTTTSLLVAEAAAGDALERARRNPGLRVGLHVAVCEGRPCLPPSEVPDLVDARGEFHHPLVAILRFFLLAPSRDLRRQLEAELRAQFEAFRATGLPFDHVNGHNNMQLHPVVLPILLALAREYGVRAVRLPYEPLWPSWRAARSELAARVCVWAFMGPWTMHVKRRLRREGFVVNDYLFGIFDCGFMTRELLQGVLSNLPPGLSEIHCHPATRRCASHDRYSPRYAHQAELEALLDPGTRHALAASGAEVMSGFGGARSHAGATSTTSASTPVEASR